MKVSVSRILSFIAFLLIILFFIWSRQIWFALLLGVVLDSLSSRWLGQGLQQLLPKWGYEILSFLYLIIVPVFIALFIRTFLIDIYFIPSSSMEHTLFPGDYVLVDKFSYGTKVPVRFQEFPIVGKVLKKQIAELRSYKILRAFSKLKRDDIVVFDNPLGDEPFLVKRIIGLPGDTLQITAGGTYINGDLVEDLQFFTFDYIDTSQSRKQALRTLSVSEYEGLSATDKRLYQKKVKRIPGYEDLIFPSGMQNFWTLDQYGPLVVPKQGMEITDDFSGAFRETANRYERYSAAAEHSGTDGRFFLQDYYFVLGDNRHHSIDSRNFGFIPAAYIQGKVFGHFSMNWFSGESSSR